MHEETVVSWDSEARAKAHEQVQRVRRRDPEAALLLQAHAVAASPQETATDYARKSFRPMEAYATLARFYRFSDSEMRKMHYPRFFAYLREANTMVEREKQQQPNTALDDPLFAHAAVVRAFGGKPKAYSGDVVPIERQR